MLQVFSGETVLRPPSHRKERLPALRTALAGLLLTALQMCSWTK